MKNRPAQRSSLPGAGIPLPRRARIGLFGGTFDPIHRGHLQFARRAQRELQLDWIYFLPAPQPWHKAAPGASYPDRYAMTALALRGWKRASPLALPELAARPTYAVDEISAVRRRHPRARLFFLLGADALADLPHWKDYPRLAGLCDWVVAPRAAASAAEPSTIPAAIPAARLHWLRRFHHPASSRQLRAAAARSRFSAHGPTTPPAVVAAYIARAGLYRAPAALR